jgi:integrase
MTESPVLIETSFADAIAIIAASTELSEQRKRHWATSLRQFAKAVNKPLELIPARYTAVRADLAQLHEVPAGLIAKTMQNHKSNVKSALLWLTQEKGIPKYGAPLAPTWERLRVKAVDNAFRRLLARAWNAYIVRIQGWPSRTLLAPAIKAAVELPWEAFPDGLRRDIEQYLQGLTRVRRSRTGQRIRPLRAVTIKTRRAELSAAVRMAVRTGVPIETLTSLSALLAPEVAEKVLDAYWRINGDVPKPFTIDLGRRFLAIAKETKCLDDAASERLDEMRRDLENHCQGGLTDKNIALIRQVLTPGVWSRVVRLPEAMMATARSQRSHAPIRAAVTAQLAVAIAILAVAPVRLANLTAIMLGINLIKPGGLDSNYWLVFPDYDVKNRVRLEYPLEQYLTRLIDEYVHDFRPALMRGRNEDWLFPGQRRGAKGKISFSGQIKERIYKATGLRMTVHQFRHAAGALILQHRPGEYELVRRFLGHRNVQTTIKAYIGLENIQASEIFSKIVMEHMHHDLEAAE